jgi:hypothetical protein
MRRTRHDRGLFEPDSAIPTNAGTQRRERAAFGALKHHFFAHQRNAAAWTLDLAPLKIHAALRTEVLRDGKLYDRKFLSKVILTGSLCPGLLSLPCDDVGQVRRAHRTFGNSRSDLVATKRAIDSGIIRQFGNTSGERSSMTMQSATSYFGVQIQVAEGISPRELYILWPRQKTTDSAIVYTQSPTF